MTPFLRLAESLYCRLNAVRRALYRRGIFHARRLPIPVISVGNIVAGGAGKTPLVIAIARHLSQKGRPVAILTRGHGRRGSVEGEMTSLDARQWGDEPVLIKKSVLKADVIVGQNRYENALVYLRHKTTGVFLLDDGFQHLQLHRDVDVVIDHPRATFHRETRAALKDADLVLVRDHDFRLHPEIPSAVVGKRVFAFAGLADSDQFFESLERAGMRLSGRRSFPDHHPYTADDVAGIRRDAAGLESEAIVTTEKDAVKLSAPDIVAIGARVEIAAWFFERLDTMLERGHGS